MTMDSLEAIRSQKLLVEQERARLQQDLLKLEQQIKDLIRTRPKRPRQTLEEINKSIKDLDFERTTTSMSLQEEKKVIRRMEKLKAETKLFAVFEELDAQLESLREKQRAIRAQISDTHSSYTQHRGIEHKFEVAKKISDRKGGVEITPDMVSEVSIQLNEDKVGIVVGKQGSALKRMVEKYAVVIDIDKTTHVATIQGILEDAEAARMALAAINEEVSAQVEVTHAQVHMLKRNKGKYLKTMEQILGVVLRLATDTKSSTSAADEKSETTSISAVEKALSPGGTLIIRGSPTKVQSAKVMVSQLATHHTIMPMPTEVISAILGSGGGTINALQDELFVGVELDRENSQLSIFGTQLQVDAAKERLSAIITENAHEKLEIPLPRAGTGAGIIGKGGETVRRIEQETGAIIKVVDGNKVVISAPASKLAFAHTQVRTALEQHEATNRMFSFPMDYSQLLTLKSGPFQKLKETHTPEVNFNFQRPPNTTDKEAAAAAAKSIATPLEDEQIRVSIRGNDPALVEQVAQKLSKLAQTLATIKVEIPDSQAVSTLIGKSGKTITQIQEDTGCVINVRDDKVVNILGEYSDVKLAESKVLEILQLHHDTNARVYVLDEAVGLLIGKGGANLKRIREKTGAKLEVNKPKNYKPPSKQVIMKESPQHGFVIQQSPVATVRVSVETPEALGLALKHIQDTMANHVIPEPYIEKVICAHVAIPAPDSCGLLLANRGEQAKRIESVYQVAIEVHQHESRVTIHGSNPVLITQQSLEGAAQQVRDLLVAGQQVQETLELRGSSVAKLDEREIRGIQSETTTKITLDRSASVENLATATISGTVKAVADAKAILLDLMKGIQRDRVRLASPHVATLTGPKAQRNLTRIAHQTSTRINVDSMFKCVRLSGLPHHVEDGKEGVRQLLAHLFPTHFELVPAPLNAIPTVIGKRGANAKKIQLAHNVSIDGLKAQHAIAISGTNPEQVQNAKLAVEEIIATWKKSNRYVYIDSSLIPAFIGKGGSGIKEIEKNCVGVSLDVDRDSSSVRVRAINDKAEMEAAECAVRAQIEKLVQVRASSEYPVPPAPAEDQIESVKPRVVFQFVEADHPLDKWDRAPKNVAEEKTSAVPTTTTAAVAPRVGSAFGGVIESKAAQKNRRRRERRMREALQQETVTNSVEDSNAATSEVNSAYDEPTSTELYSSFENVQVSEPVPVQEPVDMMTSPARVQPTARLPSFTSPAAGGSSVMLGLDQDQTTKFYGNQMSLPQYPESQARVENLFNEVAQPPPATPYVPPQQAAVATPPGFPSREQPAPQVSLWASLLPTPPPGFDSGVGLPLLGQDGGVAPLPSLNGSFGTMQAGVESQTERDEASPYYVGSGGYTVRLS